MNNKNQMVFGGHVGFNTPSTIYRCFHSDQEVLLEISDDGKEWLLVGSMDFHDFRERSRGLFLYDRFSSLADDLQAVFTGFQGDNQ